MYRAFFSLRDRPFDLTPSPRYLFLTPQHREALAAVRYAVSGRRGIAVLIGEAGTGKTTIIHAALPGCGRAGVVYLSNPTLTRAEFVEYLAHAFALPPGASASKAAFLLALSAMLADRHARGEASALIIDEAQSLPYELLEEVRLLANIETSSDKLLPVVLAGQPQLADRLNEPALRQLKQRVAIRTVLTPLSAADTAAYIAGRLRIAGARSPALFHEDAIAEIHARSGGIPRTISVICDNALVTAFAAGQRFVDRATVLEVCGDFDLQATVVAYAPVARFPAQR